MKALCFSSHQESEQLERSGWHPEVAIERQIQGFIRSLGDYFQPGESLLNRAGNYNSHPFVRDNNGIKSDKTREVCFFDSDRHEKSSYSFRETGLDTLIARRILG